MRSSILVACLGACYQPEPVELEPSCVGDDVGLVEETCFSAVRPAQVFATTDFLLDTGDDRTCDRPVPDNPDFCFVAAESIAISGVVTVRGPRPLVLWSLSSITIENTGRIDAASHLLDAVPGPGADHPSCPVIDGGTSLGTTDIGGGGCGGAFGTDGGLGGGGARAGSETVPTTCGPKATPLGVLRGGCAGGNGGLATNRGSSGGGVYLMAAQEIVVHGRINASGAAAAFTPATDASLPGGGGGGSGGLIAFDAPALNFEGAVLLAVGGGGGSGSGLAGGVNPGNPGQECSLEGAGPYLTGGSGQTVSFNTGGGSTPAGGQSGGSAEPDQTAGGGGGGGGLGYIVVFPPQVVPTPPFTAVPAISSPST